MTGIELKDTRQVNVLGGKNGVGKTRALKSIAHRDGAIFVDEDNECEVSIEVTDVGQKDNEKYLYFPIGIVYKKVAEQEL